MTIDKKLENGCLTLTLEGRLDTATSPQLQDVLNPAFDESKEIILDFAGLAYVSSAGLRVLLMGQKTAQAKEVSMKLCNVSDDIMEVFEMTGFSDILTFCERRQ
ncbi:MAG: STAS domain-containing protein [Oscillospiraceae bacterium]|nr:STAS domain-containing protein [Oscillospiraceae bacterium]